MKIDYEKYSDILKALSHPVRLQILEVLLDEKCCVTDIGNVLSISQSTVSHHLSIMKNKGIVCRQKQGTKTCYKVNNDFTLEIISFLERDK